MNKDRLRLMIDLMHEVNEDQKLHDHFSLNEWIDGKPEAIHELGTRQAMHEDLLPVVVSCGTTACACGHAGIDKRFNDLGFKLMINGGVYAQPIYNDTEGNKFIGWDAVGEFFDIGYHDSEHLFSGYNYAKDGLPTNEPLVVAERIMEFIAKYDAESDRLLKELKS